MNKTQIFNSYADFLAREDKTVNGVSPIIADQLPEWEKNNATNFGCWNCSKCSNCIDCSDCYACSNCIDSTTCSNCRNCIDCSYSTECENCVNCNNCRGLQFSIAKTNNQ